MHAVLKKLGRKVSHNALRVGDLMLIESEYAEVSKEYIEYIASEFMITDEELTKLINLMEALEIITVDEDGTVSKGV